MSKYTVSLALTLASRYPRRTRIRQRRDCEWIMSQFVRWLNYGGGHWTWIAWCLHYVHEELGKNGEPVNPHVHALLHVNAGIDDPERSILDWMKNMKVPISSGCCQEVSERAGGIEGWMDYMTKHGRGRQRARWIART